MRGEDEAPQVVYHLGLRGHPTAQVEGTDGFLSHRPHASDLAFSPSTRTTFVVDRNASNEAFEVNFTLPALERWAGRYPDLLGPLEERVGRGEPFRDRRMIATPTHEVIAPVESTMDSSRYGSLRASFVEARTVELLVRHLGAPTSDPAPAEREPDVDRVSEARDRLLARLHDPPSIPELARAVGTNAWTVSRTRSDT